MPRLDQCGRTIKREVVALLAGPGWEQALASRLSEPAKVVCPLFGALLNRDPLVRWHAVSAFGVVLGRLTTSSLEQGRVVMRRFIWNLNEESGGIGWGVPEAMAEVIATHPHLGKEFHKVYLSYIHEKQGQGADNFIDHEPLRAGAFWGVARIAQVRPDLALPAAPDLMAALERETNSAILGLACLALGLLRVKDARTRLARFSNRPEAVEVYWDRRMDQTTLGGLADRALAMMN